MNLIQSYFNKNITIDNINYAGGYLSPVINWLSMAYSCLLLKRYNPEDHLIFYGNETMVHLFENLFELPYDEYRIVDCKGEYSDWFYCWPKIITYEAQKDPFIHIDNDIFMWDHLPQELKDAPLVAQHLERDSKFYMDVYNQIAKDQIKIPDYIKTCYDGNFISSYNAGLLGGNDLSFFHQYLSEIKAFVDNNASQISSSDRRFLYNVVFEQWLFFGMTKKHNKTVKTFYSRPITDFDMKEAHVPFQILSLGELKYLHVMEYKDNIRCNRFIAYKMQSDFPQEYERILSVCHKLGVKSGINSLLSDSVEQDIEVFSRSKKLKELFNISDKDLCEIKQFEVTTSNLLVKYNQQREVFLNLQKEHNSLIDCFRRGDDRLNGLKLTLSPCLNILAVTPSLVNLLLYNKRKASLSDNVVLQIYNPTFNKIDEFIWPIQKFQLLESIIRQGNAEQLLIGNVVDCNLNKISVFLKQCLFDGIITFRA
ncbi:DUF6734 family protein [uncultured Alistipes sp.]|uniref:DUF6734 family protein n=1 Tax=uncultured Alistipes sp. TaxID=538949 RepID=UPI00261E35AC|nr:DUF6734 family protein [uncultured Alistipes sp.]